MGFIGNYIILGLLRSLCIALLCLNGSLACAVEVREGIGLNKFDLLLQYLGTASHGDGSAAYQQVERNMARKAIWDAKNLGVPYFRISLSGFFPVTYDQTGSLDLWRADPTEFWVIMDMMMADLDESGIKLVPVFAWNYVQFPAMTKETVADLLTNQQSKSYQLLAKFAREFIIRYRSRSTVVFYEMTNELNLNADLDAVARCRKDLPPPQCVSISNFTTEDMVRFTSQFATLIRELDPTRKVSSGFSVPRSSAESLRRKPEWITGKADWTPDTKEDLAGNLADIHKGIDIISVHLYSTPENRRFGGDELLLLAVLKQAADVSGKALFVGEFGGPSGSEIGPDSYLDKMVNGIVELDIPYSSTWVWEFYQTSVYATRDSDASNYTLEPGYSDRINALIGATNFKMQGKSALSQDKDIIPPKVVITWPLPCRPIGENAFIYAIASDDASKIINVEFWLDDEKKFATSIPPYKWEIGKGRLTRDAYHITVKAYDQAGNVELSKMQLLTTVHSNNSCDN